MATRSSWPDLWKKLRDLYRMAEKPRHAAVLENFEGDKEGICRKMGVISPTDIVRIATKLKPKNN